MNLSDKDKIRSIFYNALNESVFIVSVKEDRFGCSKMKCRSLLIENIFNGSVKFKKLFNGFILKWPDFIEFDELNSKIITKHSEEQAFRVWSLQTYQLLYVVQRENMAEFKIW